MFDQLSAEILANLIKAPCQDPNNKANCKPCGILGKNPLEFYKIYLIKKNPFDLSVNFFYTIII
jgi:hypothetical protein